MFAAFYDKDLNALGKWTTYACSSWSLKRRAFEFDEFTITTKEIENSNQAVYVALHNPTGSLKYLALAGKPATKDGYTKTTGVDLRQIFQQQLELDLSNVAISGTNKVKQLYNYLLNIPSTLPYVGIDYDIDLTDLDANPPTWVPESINREKNIYNLWDLIQAANALYDCYIDVEADLLFKSITFRVRVITELVNVKLSDFNEYRITNNSTVTNRVTARVKGANTKKEYYLLNDDSIVTEAQAATQESKIITPPRYETVYHESDINKAIAQALEILAKNRFQAKVELSSESPAGHVLSKIDLNTFADIYGYNSADDSTIKRLPAMAIEESEKGTVKVAFGRLSTFWF